MTDINSVTISGRLVRDCEMRYLPSGSALLNFAIATNRYEGSNGEVVSFFEVKMFGKQAETLSNYLTKGRFVVVMGELKQERWIGDGGQRSRIVIIASRVVMGGRNEKNME